MNDYDDVYRSILQLSINCSQLAFSKKNTNDFKKPSTEK
jgi:hypothetical protein